MKMYHGVKLNEVTEPQVFDPPKEMYVWDDNGNVTKKSVYAIGSQSLRYPVLTSGGNFHHCAEIPERKPVTYCELSQWLAKGNGKLRKCTAPFTIYTCLSFTMEEADKPVNVGYVVSKWDETEWHKPTREYLGLEG